MAKPQPQVQRHFAVGQVVRVIDRDCLCYGWVFHIMKVDPGQGSGNWYYRVRPEPTTVEHEFYVRENQLEEVIDE